MDIIALKNLHSLHTSLLVKETGYESRQTSKLKTTVRLSLCSKLPDRAQSYGTGGERTRLPLMWPRFNSRR